MSSDRTYVPSCIDWVREQADSHEASDGALAADYDGVPIVLLTTVGARSGALRKSPLLRIEHDGQYAIVGSSGGSPRHPTWYANVTAHPRVTLQDGATRQEYQAHEVHGAEYEEWWERALATYAGFGDYAAVAGRTFPVFVLTRVVDPR